MRTWLMLPAWKVQQWALIRPETGHACRRDTVSDKTVAATLLDGLRR